MIEYEIKLIVTVKANVKANSKEEAEIKLKKAINDIGIERLDEIETIDKILSIEEVITNE